MKFRISLVAVALAAWCVAADDKSDRAAVTLVDLTKSDTIKRAQKPYARFIAYEIDRLLGRTEQKPLIVMAHKGQSPRPLHAGDFLTALSSERQ